MKRFTNASIPVNSLKILKSVSGEDDVQESVEKTGLKHGERYRTGG
jgi:hypothetical protein